MTNLETLQKAKTKEEFAEILFKFGCDITAAHGKVSSAEWLERESKSKKDTIYEGLIRVIFGRDDEEGDDE